MSRLSTSNRSAVPGKQRMRRTLWKKDIAAWVLMLPSLFCFIIALWQPLISGVILSFFKTQGYDAIQFIGFDNYIGVMQNAEFTAALMNTFSYTLWSLLIGYLFPLVIAILLNEMVHLKPFFKFSLYFPTMVPGMATALLWYFIFDPGEGGVLNGILGALGLPASQWLQNSSLTIPLIVITMTWRGFGGTMLIYLANLQSINQDIYEAASIDGAGFFRKIRHITLPHMKGIMSLMLIMQIIGVFQVFQEPLAMTAGGPNNASMTLMLESYYYAFRYFDAGRSMAIGSITFAILLVLTSIYQFATRKSNES